MLKEIMNFRCVYSTIFINKPILDLLQFCLLLLYIIELSLQFSDCSFFLF